MVPQRSLLEKSLHQKRKNNVTATNSSSSQRSKRRETYTDSRLGSPDSSLGIGPVRRLWSMRLRKHGQRHSAIHNAMRVAEPGRVQKQRGSETYRNRRDFRFPSVLGRCPEMSLLYRSMLIRFFRSPSSGGIGPWRLFSLISLLDQMPKKFQYTAFADMDN